MANDIAQEIARQSIGPGDPNLFWNLFWCGHCRNYEGALVCKKGVFIAFEGANLSNCRFFDLGKKCAHCDKIV